jgi:hypothetical protein
MHSSDSTLASAMYQLAHDIESPDGVANAAIFEAATRLEHYAKPLRDDEQLEMVNRVHAKLHDAMPNAPGFLQALVRDALLPELANLRPAWKAQS